MISNNKICISNQWKYYTQNNNDKIDINIPHTNVLVPYNYFDEKIYVQVSTKNICLERQRGH